MSQTLYLTPFTETTTTTKSHTPSASQLFHFVSFRVSKLDNFLSPLPIINPSIHPPLFPIHRNPLYQPYNPSTHITTVTATMKNSVSVKIASRRLICHHPPNHPSQPAYPNSQKRLAIHFPGRKLPFDFPYLPGLLRVSVMMPLHDSPSVNTVDVYLCFPCPPVEKSMC